MAKMFYSLEEAAEKLGMDEQQVKDLAAEGKIQQFRDRDKLMFKRDQVDQMADTGGDIPVADDADELDHIPLTGNDDTDAIELADDSFNAAKDTPKEDAREATGISVFDADEIDTADPMAQTQVTESFSDDELSLEGIGSGSGLLDLTRESDDTSLGAELIDEVQFGGEASDQKFEDDMPSGLAAGFDSGELELGSGPSGLDHMQGEDSLGGLVEDADEPMSTAMVAAAPASDPAGSGFGAGFLFGSTIALLLGLIIGVGAVVGTPTSIQSALASGYTPAMIAAGLFVVAVIFGVVGMFVGKAAS